MIIRRRSKDGPPKDVDLGPAKPHVPRKGGAGVPVALAIRNVTPGGVDWSNGKRDARNRPT